jgi:hypothetical protein
MWHLEEGRGFPLERFDLRPEDEAAGLQNG